MLPAVRRDPTGVFLDSARRFGDVVHFKIGPRHGFLINAPADIRHVLQDNARNYQKSPLYDKLRIFLGNGLLTSEGEFWLRQRRIASPPFIAIGSRNWPASWPLSRALPPRAGRRWRRAASRWTWQTR
jgi:cytochrome P450